MEDMYVLQQISYILIHLLEPQLIGDACAHFEMYKRHYMHHWSYLSVYSLGEIKGLDFLIKFFQHQRLQEKWLQKFTYSFIEIAIRKHVLYWIDGEFTITRNQNL